MVKGNWERRCEIASIRRQKAKEDKLARKNGKQIAPLTAEAVLRKLNKISSDFIKEQIYVYIADSCSDDDNFVCRAYLRGYDCRSKKCRLPHGGVTLSHLKNVRLEPDDYTGKSIDFQDKDRRCMPPVLLSRYMSEMKLTEEVLFVAVEGECVFDYNDCTLWDDWITRHPEHEKITAGL